MWHKYRDDLLSVFDMYGIIEKMIVSLPGLFVLENIHGIRWDTDRNERKKFFFGYC